jgi:hypothetical protein
MTIMRRLVSLCCLQAKKDKGTALQIILYRLVDLASLLPVFGYTGVYITPVAVVVFLLGLWMLLRSKIV